MSRKDTRYLTLALIPIMLIAFMGAVEVTHDFFLQDGMTLTWYQSDGSTPAMALDEDTKNLTVYGSALINSLGNGYIPYDSSGTLTDSPLLVSSGNIGLGTTPIANLQIHSESGDNGIHLSNSAGSIVELNNDSGSGYMIISRSNLTNFVRIDSNGDSYFNGGSVGFGESSPLATVHIKSGDSGLASVNANSDDLLIENNDIVGITLAVDGVTGNQQFIRFATGTDATSGYITHNESINELRIFLEDTEGGTVSEKFFADGDGTSPAGTPSGAGPFISDDYNTHSEAIGNPNNPYPKKEIKNPVTGKWMTELQEVKNFTESQPKDGRNYDWRFSVDYFKNEAENNPDYKPGEVLARKAAIDRRSDKIQRVRRSPIAELTEEKFQVKDETGNPIGVAFSRMMHARIEEMENRIAALEGR